jgi:hypothetical protein
MAPNDPRFFGDLKHPASAKDGMVLIEINVNKPWPDRVVWGGIMV